MTTNIKLGYVIIYVPNVTTTVEFYERAFGLSRRFVHESGEYAEMETGATALAFAGEKFTSTTHIIEPNRPDRKAAAAEVAFVVDDVRGSYKTAIQAGATPVIEPAEKPWGQDVSYVRDLNGFLVELCSKVS